MMEIFEAGEGDGYFEKALRVINRVVNSLSLPEKLRIEDYS